MAETSTYYADSYSNEDNPSNDADQDSRLDWINPSNAGQSSDYTTCIVGRSKESSYLKAYGFGNRVPEGATITGIRLFVTRRASHINSITDSDVELLIDGVAGTNKAKSLDYYPTSDDTVFYGGSSDLWGHDSISPTQLNTALFRFTCFATGNIERTCYIKSLLIEVSYSVAGLGDEIVWYAPTLDGKHGTTILQNLADNNYNGSLVNMDASDWVADTGSNGIRCLEFDGIEDYVSVGNHVELEINTDVSISLWAKAVAFNSTNPEILLSYVNAGATAADNSYYGLAMFDPVIPIPVYIHEYGVKTEEVGAFFSETLSPNTWYHISITRNATTKEVKYYLDGTYIESFNYTNDPDGGTSSTLQIGGVIGAPDYCFDGRMDDIRIFNRILSSGEISYLSDKRGKLGSPDTTYLIYPTLLKEARWGVTES